jgi:hypothetical protein
MTGPCTEMILATQGQQPWACTPVALLRSAIKMAPRSPRTLFDAHTAFPLQHGVY